VVAAPPEQAQSQGMSEQGAETNQVYCDCGGANGQGYCCGRPKRQRLRIDRPVPMTAEELHRAIDSLCYRSGAHISEEGIVTFPSDREECGDLRELRDAPADGVKA
jgi:hypothetical protein